MNKSILKKLPTLLAILIVAGGVQTFTSCSSGDGDGNSGSGTPSSSSSEEAQGNDKSSSSNDAGQNPSSSSVSSSSNIPDSPSSSSISNSNVVYGDPVHYGGETYQTVVIGDQTWLARNLNYAVAGSKCYDDDPANCTKYGRLYDWSTAMGLESSCNDSFCSDQIMEKHQGICPNDWHIPNETDWDELMKAVGGSSTAGINLKAAIGWDNCGPSNSGSSYVCEDTYNFSALPGGRFDGFFGYVGKYGQWWGANEYGNISAYNYGMGYHERNSYWLYHIKSYFYSVRCLKD
jgi:uncharacterized protein (TIGR02145 family)